MKRIISLLLALVLTVQMLPLAVLAEENTGPEESIAETVGTQPVETEAAIEPIPTTEEPVLEITESKEKNVAPETFPEETAAVTEPSVAEGIPLETIDAILALEPVHVHSFDKTTCACQCGVYGGQCGEKVFWELTEDGTLTISGTGEMDSYVSFGDASSLWQKKRASIQSIFISDGVTSIGAHAFSQFPSLSNISIPDSIASIGVKAFAQCSSLTSISLPNSISSIPEETFLFCYNLTSITIPNSVTSIDDRAFYNCSKLAKISMPSKVSSIGEYAFFGCSSLEDVSVVDSSEYSNENTASNGILGEYAFYGCSSLVSISIPDGITSIGKYAFKECTNLSNVSISDSVTSIGRCAFVLCSSLTHISIPDSVISIGSSAFDSTGLINLTIPESVTSIGSWAFQSCDNLKHIVIPDSVTSIGNGAFDHCTSLVSVSIPNGVTIINQYTFGNCIRLASIFIPDSVTFIDIAAFQGCTSLTDVYYSGTKDEWRSVTKESDFLVLLSQNRATVHFDAAASEDSETNPVTANGTCGDNIYWKLVDNTLTIFGTGKMHDYSDNSMYGELVPWYEHRSEITEIIIRPGITYIGKNAFSAMNVKTIVVPNGVTSIASNAFAFSQLCAIELPDSLFSIDSNVFFYCFKLKDVYFAGSEEEWNTIETGDKLFAYSENVTIHFNSKMPENATDSYPEEPIPPVPVETNTSIEYLMVWNTDEMAATFGPNESKTYFSITGETDTSFLSRLDDCLGRYVLVKTQKQSGNNNKILLGMTPVKTKIGTVTDVELYTDTTITIENQTYHVSDDVELFSSYINQTVIYHILDDVIVGLDKPVTQDGTLYYWDDGIMKFSPKGTSGTPHAYILFEDAVAQAQTVLGNMGECEIHVTLKFLNGIVHQVNLWDSDGFYGKYEVEDERAQAVGYIKSYYREWYSAYQNYIDAVDKALQAYSGTAAQSREDIIKAEAKRMQDYDEDKTNDSKYISQGLNELNSEYKKLAYRGLAEYFFDYSRTEMPDFSSLKISDKNIAIQVANKLINNISSATKEYTYGTVSVKIAGYESFGLAMGTITISDIISSKHSNTGRTEVVVRTSFCATEDQCEATVKAYMEELRDMGTAAAWNVASAVYEDILGQSLSSLTESSLKEAVAKLEKRLAVNLAEHFKLARVGNVISTLNTCYNFYYHANKAYETATTDDIQTILSNIVNFKFEDKDIKDGLVKNAMGQLRKAAKKLNRALNEYIEGTIVKKEESFFRYLFGCPVNIAVYNSAREQIGYVGDDDIWFTDAIRINESGGAKEILLLQDDQLSFVITATDYGTMSCSFEEYNESFAPIGRLNYYDIVLFPEQTFQVTVPDGLSEKAKSLAITSNGKTIYADEYISATEDACVIITCNPVTEDGTPAGTVTGYGSYVRGDAAVVYAEAYEGFKFIGWYEGDNLVCVDELYEFTVKENRTLTAKFYQDNFIYIDLEEDAGGIAIGGGKYQPGDTASVLAVSYENYRFTGWFEGETQVCQTETYEFTVTTDRLLTAKFEKTNNEHVATITRIAGDGRCQTAMEAAEELKKIQGVEKFRTILVADGNNYPDALSGSYLAAVADAPILLVQANQKKVTQTVKEYILSNLTADATVYILGGTNSIPTSFETDIRTAGYTVKRLAGNDRYLTSLMIIQEGDALLAQQGKAPADSLLVCAGGGYADSLSASATGRPVLLVNGGKTALTTSQKNYLDSIGKRNIFTIGGPNSVSDAIATELNAYDTDGATMRIAGDGREETSAKVAQEFFPNADFAVLADGNNYPDGLSGGPVAYAKKAPLLLIRAKRESHAKDYVGDRIKEGYILGGPNSVSDNSAKAIFGENAIIK